MPVVTIDWLEGRGQEQKRRLMEVITKAVEEIAQVPKDHIWVVFHDVKRSDWGMGGRFLDSPPASR